MEPNDSPRVTVLIAAAGAGTRLGGAENKVLLPLAGVPLVVRAVRAFLAHPRIGQIGVIVQEADRAAFERCLSREESGGRLLPWIVGGAERQDSVYNGLAALSGHPPDWVLVHDGARPLCGGPLIGRVLAALAGSPGVVPVLPVTDTVRRIAGGHSEVLPRSELFRSQTPQGFHWDAIWEAHRAARRRGLRATDDAQLLEAMKVPVSWVEGEPDNLKITTAADLAYGEWLLGRHREAEGTA